MLQGKKNKWAWTVPIILLHILGSSLCYSPNKLKLPDFPRVLSALPGSNCSDQHVSIFFVIFLYKLSSPPTPCVIHKNVFISSLKDDVDIYMDLRSVGSTVYPDIAAQLPGQDN